MVEALNVHFRTVFREGNSPTTCTQKLLDLVQKIREFFLKILQTIFPCFFRESPSIDPQRVNQELPQQNQPLNARGNQERQQLPPAQPVLNAGGNQERQQLPQVLPELNAGNNQERPPFPAVFPERNMGDDPFGAQLGFLDPQNLQEPNNQYNPYNGFFPELAGQQFNNQGVNFGRNDPIRFDRIGDNGLDGLGDYLDGDDVDLDEQDLKEDPSFGSVMGRVRHRQDRQQPVLLRSVSDSTSLTNTGNLILQPLQSPSAIFGKGIFQVEPVAALFVSLRGVQFLGSIIAHGGHIRGEGLDQLLNEGNYLFNNVSLTLQVNANIPIRNLLNYFRFIPDELSIHGRFQKPADPNFRYPAAPDSIFVRGIQNLDCYQETIDNVALALRLSVPKEGVLEGLLFKGSKENPKIYAIFVCFDELRGDYDFYLLDIYGKQPNDPISFHKFGSIAALRGYFASGQGIFAQADSDFWCMPLKSVEAEPDEVHFDGLGDLGDEKGLGGRVAREREDDEDTNSLIGVEEGEAASPVSDDHSQDGADGNNEEV